MDENQAQGAQHTQRTLFPQTAPQAYGPPYPGQNSGFVGSPGAASEYVLARGQVPDYGQVPRSGYGTYPTPTVGGRGGSLQSINPDQYTTQPMYHGQAPYQDPRTGQIIYPQTTAGGAFDPSVRPTNPADGRRR
jgi:hypothetical protein